MRVLAISTPSKKASVSIVDFEKDNLYPKSIIGQFSSSFAKSEDISKMLNHIFEISKTDISQIELISVVKGPGSYSGLRGGLAAAKSFAQFLKKPIIAVSALESMAYSMVFVEGVIAVILDAVKEEYNFALFKSSGMKLERLTDDMVIKENHLKKIICEFKMPIYVVASFDNVKEILGKDDIFYLKSFCDSENVARVGYNKFLEGENDDPIKLVPEYSHQPNIREYKR